MGESTGSRRSNAATEPAPDPFPKSSKPKPPLPVPQALGGFILGAALLGLIAGALRHELVLTLLGAVLLTVWAYCLLAVLFLALLHRKRGETLAVRMVPEALGVGQPGMVIRVREDAGGSGFPEKGRLFRLPGVLIRYALDLSTRDGRRLNLYFDPDYSKDGMSSFTAPGRGAYYGDRDRLLVFDILGLFRAAVTAPQGAGPRLLVMPQAAEQMPPLSAPSGGVERRTDPHFLRTDDLIEHRPYVPGDDPRRINWKLYGHAGSLFVREGEPEPPPHSKLVILIDTQTDRGLYTAEAGRRGVDLLCETALALALDYTDRGMDVSIGFSGSGLQGGGLSEMAAILAHPASVYGAEVPEACPALPPAEEAQGVLILALPRAWTDGGVTAPQWSLDRFLKERDAGQSVDLLFLYGEDGALNPKVGRLEESAEACVRFYGGKGGVHAGHIRL
ncbi:MAG: DUF58 domain-containing protein [Treponema sp.]|nr:DUF58 domain-containing protein [Treponema sp.]